MALTMWACVLLGALAVAVASSMAMLGPGPITLDARGVGPVEDSGDPPAGNWTPSDWRVRVAEVDRALLWGDRGLAIRHWRDAYGAALATRRSDAMAAVGDAALRLSAAGPQDARFRAEARHAYLVALFRARAERSPAGVERVARAFEALGDHDAATHARRVVAAERGR